MLIVSDAASFDFRFYDTAVMMVAVSVSQIQFFYLGSSYFDYLRAGDGFKSFGQSRGGLVNYKKSLQYSSLLME